MMVLKRGGLGETCLPPFRYCADKRLATSFNFRGSRSEAAIWLTNTDLDFNIPKTISFRQRVSGLVI